MSLEVIPIKDIIEHTIGADCNCHPDIRVVEGEIIYIHHAYDGREKSTIFSNGLELRQEQLN